MLHQLRRLFHADLAVDLGTAHCRIALPGEGLMVDEPSVVAVAAGNGEASGRPLAVGRLARLMQGRTPESIRVVRPLREGVIADFELCEAMLRYLLAKAMPTLLRRPQVLVGVPQQITKVEKRAVLNSFQRAGARRVWLITKAKAAALWAGLPLSEPLATMVCDIGSGTTETAVLSLGDIVAARSVRVAGDRMDQAIVDYVRRHYSLRIGLSSAEQLKIDLGSAWPLEEEHAAEISGLDAISGLPRRATITSEELRQALSEPLAELVDAVHATLDRLSPELAADLVDHGLLLCGGGALLPGIDRYLNEHTGLPVRIAPEPQTVVVEGMLGCLEHFEQWRPALEAVQYDL